jgi:hypothetical protein
VSDSATAELEPCPWCPTKRREVFPTNGGPVGVIIHDTECFLAALDRRQILTPKGVAAWNRRIPELLPTVERFHPALGDPLCARMASDPNGGYVRYSDYVMMLVAMKQERA